MGRTRIWEAESVGRILALSLDLQKTASVLVLAVHYSRYGTTSSAPYLREHFLHY
jgi:hypothetical protein